MTASRTLARLRKAPLLVRRFGIIQAYRLLLPELAGETRLSRSLCQFLARCIEKFRFRDSTVLWFRPFSMDLGIFHEIWDHERYTAGLVSAVARGGTVVDIGAHIGQFSVFAARKLHARRIIGVEPDPPNFELLSRNIYANHLENAILVNVAIADESGERPIYNNPSNSGVTAFMQGVPPQGWLRLSASPNCSGLQGSRSVLCLKWIARVRRWRSLKTRLTSS